MRAKSSWVAVDSPGVGTNFRAALLRLFVARRWYRIALPTAIFVAAAMLYGMLLSRAYSGDDLQYAMVIERATTDDILYHPAGLVPFTPGAGAASETSVSLPLNPRYLLEWPTSIAMVSAWRLVGWGGDAVVPILATRVLAGALGILWFFLAVRILAGTVSASIASAGLATSSAYWTYSTHLDQSVTMVALLCLAFYLVVLQLHGSARAAHLLPVALAVATLFNATAVISAALFAVATSFSRSQPGMPAALRRLGRFALVYGLIVVGAIAIGVAVLAPPGSLLSRDYWRQVSFAGHPEYDSHLVRDAVRAALGLGKAQVIYPQGAGALQNFWDTAEAGSRLLLAAFYAVILLLMAIPIGLLAHPKLRGQGKYWCLVLPMCWLLAYALFNWWWDPGYVKYWLVPLVAWWAIVGVIQARIAQSYPRIGRLVFPVVTILVALSGAINLGAQILPERDTVLHPWPSIAHEIQNTDATSLFISAGGHPLDFHIAYFARRDVISVGLIRYGANGDEEQVKQVVSTRLAQHRAVSSPVYIYGLDTLGPAERANVLAMLSGMQLHEVDLLPGVAVYEAAWQP